MQTIMQKRKQQKINISSHKNPLETELIHANHQIQLLRAENQELKTEIKQLVPFYLFRKPKYHPYPWHVNKLVTANKKATSRLPSYRITATSIRDYTRRLKNLNNLSAQLIQLSTQQPPFNPPLTDYSHQISQWPLFPLSDKAI